LDEARDRVAGVWQCKPSEVVFTSGGTESNNLAIFGVARQLREKGRHIITSSVEHHAVLHPCEYLVNKEGFNVTYLPVDEQGRVRVRDVENALDRIRSSFPSWPQTTKSAQFSLSAKLG
jgi:cysteine desulfurase